MKYIHSKIQNGYLTRRGLRGRFLTAYLHYYGGKAESTERYHSHPWKWAISIVLKGGFIDEYETCNGSQKNRRRIFSVSIYDRDLRHRVLDSRAGTISLFFGIKRDQMPSKSATEKVPEGFAHYSELNGQIKARNKNES